MKGLYFGIIAFLFCIKSFSQSNDTLAVYNNFCESINPFEIDTTIFKYVNDTLSIRNVKIEFCCPRELLAIVNKINDTIKIHVINPSGVDCLCDCSYGYTVKIPNPMGDTFNIVINDESFTVFKSKLESGLKNSKVDILQIFPNPVNDILNIDNIDHIEQIIITDISSKILYESNKGLNQIDLSDLKPGLYLLSIKTSKYSVIKKIIKK